MLVRYSLISDASGSFGGLVASHNRSGQYIRTRVRPTNPSSPAQVEVRVIFGNLAITWSTLTDDQRDAWTTYAINVPVTNRLGDPLTLTGHQMFVRNNAARIQAGLDRIDDGPTTFSTALLTKVFVNPNQQPINLLESFFPVVDPWATDIGAAFLIYATRQGSGTVLYRRNPYRFAGSFIGRETPPVPLQALIPAPFELNDNGSNHVFVRYFVVLSDGRMSPPVHERRLIKTT